MSTSTKEMLWPEMADGSTVAQLDVLFVLLASLTLIHAVYRRGALSGTAAVFFLLAHTAFFEHVSLFLGGTHCHATSPLLPMVTPCSSVNSLLFYAPWIYTSLEAARRLDLSPAAFPFAVGLLQIGFGAPYEMQGPAQAFWRWPTDEGIIADAETLVPWEGYPPLTFLAEAKELGEVATISSTGSFRVSGHAGEALLSRTFLFPVLAPYFHFSYGFAWALGLALTGAVGSAAVPAFRRLLVAGALSVVLFLPPIWITRQVSEWAGLPLRIGVPLSLAASALPVLLAWRSRRPKAHTLRTDPLLFAISLLMHGFMVTIPWRSGMPRPSPPGLSALVAFTSVVHLIAQYHCCIRTGVEMGTKLKRKGA